MIETITVAEATEELRRLGLRISPDTIRDGLEQGKYPFGVHIKSRNGGNVYQIYTKLFRAWIDERQA